MKNELSPESQGYIPDWQHEKGSMRTKGSKVANDQAWQRRTDEWVKMSDASRKRKEDEKNERRRRGVGYIKTPG